jgi:L-ascorbate metabolism protein UlaG (beta-lactamase superfamily)
MRVTNVPTNIRGEMIGGDGFAGNSIFVFESAGMCIAHLGHLHHRLKPDHAGRVGSVDVMLAPIDGIYTMSQELLVQVIDDLKPQVVIPMHYGYGGTLERWVAMMRERKFDIREANSRSVRFSKVTLPGRPTVVVLQGGGY